MSNLTDSQKVRLEAALQAILDSRQFARACRLQKLLKYLVEASLNDKVDQLKGYTLGVEVFERPETFDPQTDTVVRVTAVRLRNKLAEYYQSLDTPPDVEIVLPSRSYVPQYTFHQTPPPSPVLAQAPQSRQQPGSRWLNIGFAMVATLLVVLVSLGYEPARHSGNEPPQTANNVDSVLAQGKQLMVNEDFNAAINHYRQALASTPDNSEYLRQLGQGQLKLARLNAAKASFESALAIDMARHAADDIAQDQYLLANYYKLDKQFEKAVDFYRRAIDKFSQDQNNLQLLAKAISGQAKVLLYLGQTAQAQTLLKQGFALEQQKPLPAALSAELYAARSLLYRKTGKLLEASYDTVRALELAREAYGEHHSLVVKYLGELASMYGRLSQHQRAEETFNQAIAATRAKYGTSHPKLAKLYNNFGSYLHQQGDLQQARQYYEQAIEINRQRTDGHGLSYALNLYNLGLVHQQQQQHSSALTLLNQSLSFYIKAFGQQHSEVAIIYEDIGNSHLAMGRQVQAREHYSRALGVYKTTFGPQDDRTTALKLKLEQLP